MELTPEILTASVWYQYHRTTQTSQFENVIFFSFLSFFLACGNTGLCACFDATIPLYSPFLWCVCVILSFPPWYFAGNSTGTPLTTGLGGGLCFQGQHRTMPHILKKRGKNKQNKGEPVHDIHTQWNPNCCEMCLLPPMHLQMWNAELDPHRSLMLV